MKRIIFPFILLSALLLGGCHEDIDQRIEQLKHDVTDLEAQVGTLNENTASLASLVSALEKNDHITDITPYSLLSLSGYMISFSSGTTLRLRNGTDGVSPIVGVRYNEDYDAYYWTIQLGPDGTPVWMTDNSGRRVRATSWVPQLKIEEGLWWYSFDGTYWNKTNWAAAQGQTGTSFFSSIDTSDPYYVTFVLADGTRFQIPTQHAVDELSQQCEAVNDSFKTYIELMQNTDSSIFVKSVAAFEENGISGARITLESGKVLTIRNGLDNRDSVLLSVKNYTDGKAYWVFRNRSDEEYRWLMYNGQMICVTQDSVTPYIGIVDSLGQLYFTVAYGDGPAEKMRDAEGNAVVATGHVVPDFFTAADISDASVVVLTLADGTQVRLPKARIYTPAISFSLRSDFVEPATNYTYHLLLFVKDTLQQTKACTTLQEYQAASGTKIEAVALDDGHVDEVKLVSMSVDSTDTRKLGYVAYDMIFDVQFTTGPLNQWNTDLVSRYVIFLSWQTKSIMKVVEFTRAIKATDIQLSQSALELTVGGSAALTATVTPSYTTDKTTWRTSDGKVATVSDTGVVTAVAPGTCTITATAGRRNATCTVTVKPAV